MKWIIWYDDFSSFSSEDGEPWDAPRLNVVCIALAHQSCGRFLISGDYYCWHFEDEEWLPHNWDGVVQYLQKPGKEKIIIMGIQCTKDRWTNIMHIAAREDDRLPPRTAEGSVAIPDAMKYRA